MIFPWFFPGFSPWHPWHPWHHMASIGDPGISWPDLGERRGGRSPAAVGRRSGLRAEFAAGTAMPGRGGQGLRREKGLEHLETWGTLGGKRVA